MSRDLKDEVAVAAFIKELVVRQAPDWQPAEHERPRTEAQVLRPMLALDADQFDTVGLSNLLLGNNQIAMSPR